MNKELFNAETLKKFKIVYGKHAVLCMIDHNGLIVSRGTVTISTTTVIDNWEEKTL